MASIGSTNAFLNDFGQRVNAFVNEPIDLSRSDRLKALESEAASFQVKGEAETQKLSWIRNQLQQVREIIDVLKATAPKPHQPRVAVIQNPVRGTINQFAIRSEKGSSLGTSACVSQACQALLTLSFCFRTRTPLTPGAIDRSLREGGRRHCEALKRLGEADGENLMIDQIARAGLFPELRFQAERDKSIPKTLAEARAINGNILGELAATARRDKIAMAVMIHGPEGSSLMAREAEDKSIQFYHFDSHADTTVQPVSNCAYVYNAKSAEDMARYLERRYPFDRDAEPVEYSVTPFGVQMNPNAVEVRFVAQAPLQPEDHKDPT